MTNTKQAIFLEEIAFKYIPQYTTNTELQKHWVDIANTLPKAINVEHLTEVALAIVGGYNFIDGEYQDYDDIDRSDSKTASIIFSSKQVFLGNIGKKKGALRITIFNPYTESIDYMFMPYGNWQNLAKRCHGENTEGKLRLIMTWSQDRDSYNQFEPYRLNTFTELATMTAEKFYKIHPELMDIGSEFNAFFGESENILNEEVSKDIEYSLTNI